MTSHKNFQGICGFFIACAISVRLSRSVFGGVGLLPIDVILSIVSFIAMLIVVLWQVYREKAR